MRKLIIFLKNHLRKYFVSGQFKKEKTYEKQIISSGGRFFREETFDWKHQKLVYEQIMTYIVSGRYNNKTFLMVDCVGTKNDGTHVFCDKLNKLRSTKLETYFAITGYDAFEEAINLFDKKCFNNETNFDINNETHIEEVLEIYYLLIARLEYNKGVNLENNFYSSSIFFIQKDFILIYHIRKGENNKNEVYKKINLMENNIAESSIIGYPIQKDVFNNSDDIIKYCKKQILGHYKLKTETKNLDLKDRFSFIMFDGDNKSKIQSIKNNKELVLSTVAGNYNEIE